MGYKMQLNGVDNAKLIFDNVRVPRENLLNKFSDVDENGVLHMFLSGGELTQQSPCLTTCSFMLLYFRSVIPSIHVY